MRRFLRRGELGGQIERDGRIEETFAHLPVPVAWLDGRGRKGLLQRLQKAELAGIEEDGDVGLHQGLLRVRTAPVGH